MSGGTAKLVKSGTPSSWPGAINLYVYYKVVSQSVANNTTTLSLGMYVVTPSGWDIGEWSDYYGSYVGTATSGANCKTFDGAIPNFSGTRWLVENQQVTVTHNADGTKTATIYWKWGVSSSWGGFDSNSGSFNVTLTTIPRASSITSASAVTLGNKCSVKWTPNAASFRYKLKFSIGDWNYTTGAIHPNTTSTYTYTGYTIPLEAANQLPSAKTGTMTVTLYTYSNSAATTQVGSASSKTFTVTVPNNSATQPSVSMTLTPESSLSDAFDGLYIQGKTKVKATLDATGKYGASIKSFSMKVEGSSYDSGDSYTSDYLSVYGTVTVTGYATDSRGYTGSTSEDITVIAYSKPQILAASGESEIVAARCDADGNLSDSGTYLKIKAKRSYSPVKSGGVQKNFCKIRYRYKLDGAASYSSWATILAADSLGSDEVVTDALLGGTLSAQATYLVQVQAIDDIGSHSYVTISVPTDKVYMHRDGARNALAFGKYVEEDNCIDIAEDIKLKIRGEKWVSLGLSDSVSESASNCGRGPEGTGCWYRVVNDNHIHVAFNCAYSYAGATVTVNAEAIPEAYRPTKNAYAICATGGRAVARIIITKAGNVVVDWIQVLSSAEATTASTVSWIDGYIDYFV